jgi:hypothetical protein
MPNDLLYPCFHFSSCRQNATVEKSGKSLCRSCADRLEGREYPLRPPTREPLYKDDQEVSESLDIPVPRRKNNPRIVISVA